MLKAQVYRLYPSKAQEKFIVMNFDYAREVYNLMLAEIKMIISNRTGEKFPTPAKYKNWRPWLKDADSLALVNAQNNIYQAFENFFRDKKNFSFPRYKQKKNSRQSYTTNNQNGTIRIENGYVKLPKLRTMIKIVEHRKINGVIRSATISRNGCGQYFISILFDTDENMVLPELDNVVGIDVGIKNSVTLSNGIKYENPKYMDRVQKRRVFYQKQAARRNKGSRNKEKSLRHAGKLLVKACNQLRDYYHKISTKIIHESQVIVIEGLHIEHMVKNHKLSRNIYQSAWNMFFSMLRYKCEWYGRTLIVAPSNYPSSQLCSSCGYKNSETKNLSVREWICPHCGTAHDRDINASINLKKYGEKYLANNLRLGQPLKPGETCIIGCIDQEAPTSISGE